MADQQVKMIMEAMLTLKSVDSRHASSFFNTTEDSSRTDALLQKILQKVILDSSKEEKH